MNPRNDPARRLPEPLRFRVWWDFRIDEGDPVAWGCVAAFMSDTEALEYAKGKPGYKVTVIPTGCRKERIITGLER